MACIPHRVSCNAALSRYAVLQDPHSPSAWLPERRDNFGEQKLLESYLVPNKRQPSLLFRMAVIPNAIEMYDGSLERFRPSMYPL